MAIAVDEVLVLGDIVPNKENSKETINYSIKKLNTIEANMKSLFYDTLDEDLQINILKLIATPKYINVDENIQNKLYESDIQIVCLEEQKDNYLLKCLPLKNAPNEEEKDDFEAYKEYIETVINYFKNV